MSMTIYVIVLFVDLICWNFVDLISVYYGNSMLNKNDGTGKEVFIGLYLRGKKHFVYKKIT